MLCITRNKGLHHSHKTLAVSTTGISRDYAWTSLNVTRLSPMYIFIWTELVTKINHKRILKVNVWLIGFVCLGRLDFLWKSWSTHYMFDQHLCTLNWTCLRLRIGIGIQASYLPPSQKRSVVCAFRQIVVHSDIIFFNIVHWSHDVTCAPQLIPPYTSCRTLSSQSRDIFFPSSATTRQFFYSLLIRLVISPTRQSLTFFHLDVLQGNLASINGNFINIVHHPTIVVFRR